MKGFSLVAHNGAGFDNPYLFHHLITDFGLTVDPIYSGSKLLQFVVKKSANNHDYLIRGIDSAQFFLAPLKVLSKQFGLNTSDLKKGFFPYNFDKPKHWDYVGEYPDISYYSANEMSTTEADEIKAWHEQQDAVFHFRKEMLDYCLQDVRILLSDCGKIDYLRRCASLLVDWKYQKRAGFTVAMFDACIQTFNGLADLAEHLLQTHDFSFVLLGKTYEICNHISAAGPSSKFLTADTFDC